MTKIEWKGWHQFGCMAEFLRFVKENKNIPHNTILWPNPDCPIIIWLN